MKDTCAKCQKALDNNYGGYAITELKNLCPQCWEEYIKIKTQHYNELTKWWGR